MSELKLVVQCNILLQEYVKCKSCSTIFIFREPFLALSLAQWVREEAVPPREAKC